MPPTKSKGYIPVDLTPIETELPEAGGLTEGEALAVAVAQEDEQATPAEGIEPWREAVLFLLDAGMPADTVPRLKGKFLAALAQNSTWQSLISAKKPALAEALDIAVELPLVLFRLESTNREASAALGKELYDLNISEEAIIAFLPNKADVIRKSLRLRDQQMIDGLKSRTDELALVNAGNAQKLRESIAAHGHPGPAARKVEREALRKRVLKQAGLA